MKRLFTLTASCLFSVLVVAQNEPISWKAIAEKDITPKGVRQIIPQKYVTFRLSGTVLKDKLWSAPDEKSVNINASPCIVYLPVASGQVQAFRVVESSIMEPELAQAYPQIKTFSIKGIDDPYANGKLDWNDFGFHGMIRSVNGDIFIDPYSNGNSIDYISYYTSDFLKNASDRLPEAGLEQEHTGNKMGNNPVKQQQTGSMQKTMSAACMGAKLRTYRLAIACTHQYAIAATGTSSPSISQTLAKIVTSVNRVDGVYETEVAVRMVLIATETLVVYANATSDPFTGNNNANILINESQTVIGGNIGAANYDIGHTFSTGGGGLAYLGCVCGSNKARGITGSPSPVGDPYDIDYVAHEMGHQFGGNHTFNGIIGSCGGGNRNASTAVEPGSGITIMAYAGICGSDDLAPHSIAYFHCVSYDEIVNYTNSGGGNVCPVITNTGNNPPSVTGSITYTVPKSTPFTLTGSATDPDIGDTLTYQWEEIDLGPGGGGPWNSGTKPYFMSHAPISSPSRMFPQLSVVLSGLMTSTKGEYSPGIAQTLNFRLTVRDNKMGGGGVCSAISQVVIDTSGPLIITYPNVTGITWPSGSTQTITWNVNNTNLAPVNCSNVNVLLSYDNGTTFTTTLMSGTPNNGSLTITVPTVTATVSTCRIRVESVGNIFFDINDRAFTISTVTGLNELSSNNATGLSIAPNPFSDNFNLKATNLDASSETMVTITDVLGKIVKQDNLNGISNLSKSYNLEGLSRGLYFVSVKNNNRQSVARIVKQ
jgi:hypothetical protein